MHPVPTERRRRAHLPLLAAGQRHRVRRADPDDPVQGEVGAAEGVRLRRALLLSRAAGGGYPRVSDRRGAGRRGPEAAHRAGPNDRGAFQLALRRPVHRPEASDPGGGGSHPRPAAPRQEDVDDRRVRAGDRVHPRPTRRDRTEVQVGGHTLSKGEHESARQARDFEPDRDHGRGAQRRSRGDRARVRERRRLRAVQGRRRCGRRGVPATDPDGVRGDPLGRVAARVDPARGGRQGARDRGQDGRDRGRSDGPRRGLGSGMTSTAGSGSAERPDGGAFAVELPVFTGPFRVLADLILAQKIDVCDVSIATVTDGFLAHSKEAEGWSLEEATWFLAVCAIMLELKVGRLMPRHEVVDEEDLLGVSPDLVYARSIELAAFRTVAVEIARGLDEESLRFTREAGPPAEFAHLYPDVLEDVSADDLARIAAVALRPPPMVDLSHVTPIRYTMAEAVEAVRVHLGRLGQASFRDLVADCDERIQIVVRFLALLELYREGKVDLAQAATFGEIDVRWEGEAA